MATFRQRWINLPVRTKGLLLIALPIGSVLAMLLAGAAADVEATRVNAASLVVGIGLAVLAMCLLTGEINHAQAETARALREQQVLNRELESFSYSVSHDLRAPLRAIDGFALALVEETGGQLTPTCQHYLERVRAGAQHMGGLIDALLTLARVSRVNISAKPLDVSSLARSIANDLDLRPDAPKTTWVIADGLHVMGDPELMRVVLQNLIENAWKFSARTSQPRIEVRGATAAQMVTITVSDNGVGFDEQHATRLFGTFQRLHHDFPGTGIGLATVQRIVHRHGGVINATAEVGKGASFAFSLPIIADV